MQLKTLLVPRKKSEADNQKLMLLPLHSLHPLHPLHLLLFVKHFYTLSKNRTW